MKPAADGALWDSRLARRLVKIFVLLVAVPLTLTVLILGRVGREQIVRTARSTQEIQVSALGDAGREFQRLGREAVHRSSQQTADISIGALRSVSREVERIQNDALAAAARDITRTTGASFDAALQQSLHTNRKTLTHVNDEMTRLFERSARDTQSEAAARVGKAMRVLIESSIEERARNLARLVEDHVEDAVTALTITAQMPNLHDGDVAGQKAVLDALVRRYPVFTLASVLDAEGRETAMSAADRVVVAADLRSRPDAAYFRKALSGDRYTEIEERSPDSAGAPVLRLAVPIERYRGRVAGVLTARLSLADLWEAVRGARIGRDGFAYVLDREGRALLAPPPSGPRAGRGRALIERSGRVGALGWQVIAAQPEDEVTEPIRALERGILQNTQTTLRAMRSDIGRVARGTSARLQKDALAVREQTAARVRNSSEQVFEALKQTTERQTKRTLVEMQHAIATRSRQTDEDSSRRMVGASAAASERLAERVTPLTAAALARANRRLALGALVILGVSCAAGCLVALLIAGRIVRPVIRLSQSARSIAEGDLDGRVDERAPDEIGDLAAAFNSMAASLQKSRAELQGAEAQLVQSAKLASLGTLAAGVAHELNQPVAIVRGISQQLRGEPGLSPDVRADLELIEGQTSRMMKIIKHLRTFSRVGGPELADVAVNAVVRDCFVLVGAQLKAHDIDVEWDLCEDEPGRGGSGALVRGDANELEQVFLNLITNARDAVENRKGGRLAISSRLEGDRFVLVFRDNGTGIPEAVLPHIFDPFFTTKDPGKGTGLGLSISHGIIAKHGGTITARNDNGAVFTISLPVAPAAAGNETPAGPIPLAKAA